MKEGYGFELTDRAAAGRLGRFTTPHGTVTTPTLLPVLNPNLPLLNADILRELGAEMVITNAYILWKHADLRTKALERGVHRLLGWDGPVMTDSGTFQSYVYGNVDIGPEEVVSFEREIGVDVGTILDVFTVPETGEAEARAQLMETVERAKASRSAAGPMGLAVPVQGGAHPALREEAARLVSGLDAVLHPIGGVVPIMESYRYALLADVVTGALAAIDPSRPVHLFGAGHPVMLAMAVAMGCDLFDSSAYAKFASEDRLLTVSGTVRLEDLRHRVCDCPVCVRHDPDRLRALPASKRRQLIAEHNLRATFGELERIRQAIAENTLWDLVDTRSRAHPALLEGYRRLLSHRDYLEEREPAGGRVRYAGPESVLQPSACRFRERVKDRLAPLAEAPLPLLPRTCEPYARGGRGACTFEGRPAWTVTPLGALPIALDETAPVAQSLFPAELSEGEWAVAEDHLRAILEPRGPARHIDWRDLDPAPAQRTGGRGRGGGALVRGPADQADAVRLRLCVAYQFGLDAVPLLLSGALEVARSPRVGRIRNVFVDGEHVLSVRAEDGWFTLKPQGARRLLPAPTPRYRVVVHRDAVPFVREGRNVFARFVLDSDPELRPGDEAAVVGPDGTLAAVGRVLLTFAEMQAFERGVAVRVREGVKEDAVATGHGEGPGPQTA